MRVFQWNVLLLSLFFVTMESAAQRAAPGQQVHTDVAFRQRFSVQYQLADSIRPRQVRVDRSGVVQVLASSGLLRPSAGALLHPGQLVPDLSYRPMRDKNISALGVYRDQFVYADDKAVFSNAWAGKLYAKHTLAQADAFCGGEDFSFLVANGNSLQYLKDSLVAWSGNASEIVNDIVYDRARRLFWLLGKSTVATWSPDTKRLLAQYTGERLSSLALSADGKNVLIGTADGYIALDGGSGKPTGTMLTKLPCTDITVIRIIDGHTWFGSAQGAFMLRDDGKFDYYASRRWLPSNKVLDIAEGQKGSVLILTDKGLTDLRVQSMSLQDKAMFFEQQVRSRHIRNGFNSAIIGMKDGDPDSGVLEDSDNDGLWTSMYLGGEVFRYAVTHSPDALQNCRESLDAMERLYTITSIKGFPARSFERHGYALHDKNAWKQSKDSGWDWKSTTSSDEAIGHIFVFGAMAELIDDADLKARSIRLIDALMQHIVDHNLYMIDWNGEPTRWGRWNPEYVNARPVMVGDRKITSSNIIAMLQTAWHFTHKEIYRTKAFELMQKYGYLENLMRPMKDIGRAPENADELSKELSNGWNHSDDEMYFLGYWGLYRYALNDTLKAKFKESILDHWQAERPEKEAAWNITTALTGTKEFDLKEAVGYLQRYPLDLINWSVTNSSRKDIEKIEPNFRGQTIREVLPPDESPIQRHNANLFTLDGGHNGRSEESAGDIWLLPYWMGRYLGVITAPAEKKASK